MKTRVFFCSVAISMVTILMVQNPSFGQFLTDSTANYFTLTEYYDHFYDSLITVRGFDSMQGTGFKDYLKWKWFYANRHGSEGSLTAVWDSLNKYNEYSRDPENYIDRSAWEFVGPTGVPLGYDDSHRPGTGKGMMLSLWVNPDNHSNIIAGAHHSGLWKTFDSGNSWFPLHDLNPEISGVNSIAVDPTDPNNIYITSMSDVYSMVSYSQGIFVSHNGGTTWARPVFLEDDDPEYPSGYYGYKVRKVIIDPIDPSILYFVNLQNVYKSEDYGDNWFRIYHGDYNPWGVNKGLWDLEVDPINHDIIFFAGSEAYMKIGDNQLVDITQSVFNPQAQGEYNLVGFPMRTDISINKNFPNKVWFGFIANYLNSTNEMIQLFRIVEYDYNLNIFTLRYENENTNYSEYKLSVEVSPSNENIFYAGGIYFSKINSLTNSNEMLSEGKYPEPCWLHVDIRDIKVFGDNTEPDTIFSANDAGISWGTSGETCMPGNAVPWKWNTICSSVENGLDITEFYGFGLSESEPYLLAGGCQDVNNMLRNGNEWINFGKGDGGDIVFDYTNPNNIYFQDWQYNLLYRSNDLGRNLSENGGFYIGSGLVYVQAPILLDPLDPSILYFGPSDEISQDVYKEYLLQFDNVNDFNQIPPSLVLLETTPNHITDIEVALNSAEERRFYISTNKTETDNPPPDSFSNCIYRKDGAGDWTDISPYLLSVKSGFITDIEFNKNNIDELWVSCGQFSEGTQAILSKVYYSSTGGLAIPGFEEDTWIDFSEGLPPGIPVYKIKYMPALKTLYAATDVGIYKRFVGYPKETQWYPYNNNLPLKIVTDMELNMAFGKLFISTLGRGIWEEDLEICGFTDPPYVVDEQENWNTDDIIHGDITIESGGKLTISNCSIYLPENARIIVKQGGELVIDHALLTSSCNALWSGIEVWGSPGYQLDDNLFGRITMLNGATIEHARTAIANYNTVSLDNIGGTIVAKNSIFRNNQIGIDLMTFTNVYQGQEYPYIARFKQCRFENTLPLLSEEEFKYFVKFWEVNGPAFQGCDFINTLELDDYEHLRYTLPYHPYTAIYSNGAQFYLKADCLNPNQIPCQSFKRNTFEGLNYAIYAVGFDPIRTVDIKESDFYDNITGVYLSGLSEAKVVQNNFYLRQVQGTQIPVSCGLYLDFCTGYHIEENYFSCINSMDDNTIGLVVKDSGEESNEIYRNTFDNNLEFGIEALNKNRSAERGHLGLVIKCNNFAVGDYNDIHVEELGIITDFSGIAEKQGYIESVTSPAGNLFTMNDHPAYWDYNNLIDRNEHEIHYSYHDPDIPNEPRVKPNHFDDQDISLFEADVAYDPLYSCPSNINLGSSNEIKNEMIILETQLDSIQNEVNVLLDDGNTDALVSEIILSVPQNAYDLYEELMYISPFLSDTVITETIGKEDVVNNVMLEEILIANPHSVKSSNINQALLQKNNPFTENQQNNINQGISILSTKETLELKIAERKYKRALLSRDLKMQYKMDTVNIFPRDSLNAHLISYNSINDKYLLGFSHLQLNDTLNCRSTLEDILTSFYLSCDKLNLHQQYEQYININIELLRNGSTSKDLDSLQIQDLYELYSQNTIVGTYAKNKLQIIDSLLYIEPYVLTTGQMRNQQVGSNKIHKGVENERFKVFPNPALTYFIVECENANQISELIEFYIYSADGRFINKYQLNGKTNHKVITTRNLIPGLYICNFVVEGRISERIKIAVLNR